MDTKITPENPFGCNRYGFAWEHVPGSGTGHLDFGCYQGSFLDALRGKGIGRLVGVDVSSDAVQQAQSSFGEIEFIHVPAGNSLPFADGAFTSVTIMDVLEHICNQREVLCELNRVLSKDGALIVTVPGRHIFSFVDMGNLKFRFPRLHRWYYCLKHSETEYKARYESNPDGLVGDISAEKGWHEHFSRDSLKKLLNDGGFAVVTFDGAGLFTRVIGCIHLALKWLKPVRFLLETIYKFDAKRFKSANLFCIARKTQQ
jgi:SAM-dependent methyltransferase